MNPRGTASRASSLEAAGEPPPTAPLSALAVTFGVQTLAALTMAVPSVLAPAMAVDLGIPAQSVGWFVSLAYLAAMISGLSGGGLASRHGSVRLSQWALVASAGGLALLALGQPALLLAAAVVVGVGYGLPNPTGAEILSRHAPTGRRGLFFSIKQTGVPVGVALAGVLLPWLLALVGWRWAALSLGVPMVALGIGIGSTRAMLDGPLSRAAPTGRAGSGIFATIRAGLIAPLAEVLAFAPTRRLAIVSLVFALTQVSFLTFFVSLLKIEHGFTLALAAGLLAASQAVSVGARIGWGHVSDRWVDPTRLLGLLGLAMGGGIAMLGLAPAGTPWLLMLLVTLLCAGTAVAWNGVYFADLVRHLPPERVAQATGATQFLTFFGGMCGSALFAGLVGIAGSYSAVYAGLALLPAGTGAVLLFGARRSGSTAGDAGPPR
jgi:MFS family permease